MISIKELSEKLSKEAEIVTKMLLPNGKKLGNEYVVGSINGEEGQSLKIHLTGEKTGVWADFATGDKGADLIDLWVAVKKISLAAAIQQVKEYLRIREPEWVGPKHKNFKRPEKLNCSELNKQSQVTKYLAETRKLKEETLKIYKIAEQTGKIVFPYFREGELILAKYLDLERPKGKKIISAEENCEPCLFGWQAVSDRAREIVISEGEIDAMTLWQYGFPALSVPFGGGKGAKQQWIEHEFENLIRFEIIYLCFDNDPEGQIALEEIINRLGRHRCKVVTLPGKDANECLQKGITKNQIELCFKEAMTLDPVELKPASAFLEEVIHEFYPPEGELPGFSLPWPSLMEGVRFRPAELSVWTGTNGHGKSIMINQVMLEAMQQGEKVCIASLEIKPKKLLYRLYRQATALADPSITYLQLVNEWADGKLWIFDMIGSVKGDALLQVFRYARQRYGVTQFVIDSLMKCGIGEDDYNAQKLFVEALADFKNEYDVHVHLIAHARKGENEERLPGKLDVKGTGAITDLADNTFAVWRNKRKEEEMRKAEYEKRNPNPEIADAPDALFICDKQRNGDWEGKFYLSWHQRSYQFLENSRHKPKEYVIFPIPDPFASVKVSQI